jgi:FkbM family methyltransferase
VRPDQRRYGPETYSHSGADLVVLNIFELLGIERPSYLDIGAHHPTDISNTALLYSRGSRGVNVEANPDLIEEFYKDRPEDTNINVGITPAEGTFDFYRIDPWSGRNTFSKDAAVGFVEAYPDFRISDILNLKTMTLNQFVDTHCHGVFPDFLSIDIEGLDYDVLLATNFGYTRPKVICVETVDFLGKSKYGQFCLMLRGKGFVPYCRLVADAIFLWHEDAHKLEGSLL